MSKDRSYKHYEVPVLGPLLNLIMTGHYFQPCLILRIVSTDPTIARRLDVSEPSWLRTIRQLKGHHWPGNIRELKNVVERSLFRAGDTESLIKTIVIDPFARKSGSVVMKPGNVYGNPDSGRHAGTLQC